MSWRLLAFGLAVGLALAGQSFLGRGPYLTDALLLFGAAGAFALWAMGLAPRPAAIDEPPGGTRTLESGRAPLRRYLPAVAIGAGPAACVLGVLYLWTGNPYGASVFLWLLSLFLLFFGLYRLDGPPRLRVTRRLLLAEGVPLAIIMSIAAFLRFYQLDTAPPGSLSDEGVVAWMVTLLARGLDGPVKGPFDIAWNSPNLPYYPMALAFKMMGTSILASRTVMAVYGLVSVGAFYFLARHLFGAAPALAGTFLLGVSRWHFHFSRIGWEATMQTVVLSILAVLLVLRGRRSGRPTDFAWAGLSTGLCLYLYQSGQLLLPALALLFAYVLLVERRALSSAFRWGVLAFILAAGLTVAPLTATIAKDPARYMHRASEVSLWGHAERNKQDIKALLGQNLQSTLLMFNYRGDSAVRHNIPNEPALDTITAALFVLGAVWGLSRAYTREGFLLLSWLLVSLMASVLSLPDNNPSMPRALGAIPPAYLLVTGFLSQVWVAVQRARPPRWDGPPAWAWRSAGAAAIGLFAVAGYLNYDAYFNRYVHRDDTWREFQNIEWGVSRAIVSLSGSHTVLLSPELASSEVVRFAAVAANVSFRQVGRNDIPFVQPLDKGLGYVMSAGDETQRGLLEYYYPGGDLQEARAPWGPTVYYTYAVEKPQAEARQGLLGRYYPNPGGPPGSSAQALPRQAIALHQGGAWPLSSLSAAEWEGGLYAPQYGAYRFSLAGRGAADLEIDGRKVVELAPGQAGAEGTATLYQGMHSLSARYRAGDGPPTLELKWAPPGKGFEPVPMEYLTPVGPRQDQGLTATYFEGADWQGSPLFQRVDGSVDFWWPREEPIPDRSFSVEWSGWLEVQRAGDYRFDVFSHDGAWLYVDDRLVVDNGGQHPEQWRGGQANLQPGQRRIRVRYFQVRTAANIGPKGIRLYWTPPGSPRQVIPSDALRPLDTK